MQSGEVSSALAQFAREHEFKFIPKTVAHWQILTGRLLVNVYYGRKGFSLYVDSSSPQRAFRTHSISVIYEQIMIMHNTAAVITVPRVQAPPAVPACTGAAAESRPRRLSATKVVDGMKCRVSTTCPTGVADGQPGLSHVVLISDGVTQLGVILHDSVVDESVTTYDAANVSLSVCGVEPTKQLVRLLRFAAYTLEEMLERNMRAPAPV